jgi:hypothetical protein
MRFEIIYTNRDWRDRERWAGGEVDGYGWSVPFRPRNMSKIFHMKASKIFLMGL